MHVVVEIREKRKCLKKSLRKVNDRSIELCPGDRQCLNCWGGERGGLGGLNPPTVLSTP